MDGRRSGVWRSPGFTLIFGRAFCPISVNTLPADPVSPTLKLDAIVFPYEAGSHTGPSPFHSQAFALPHKKIFNLAGYLRVVVRVLIQL